MATKGLGRCCCRCSILSSPADRRSPPGRLALPPSRSTCTALRQRIRCSASSSSSSERLHVKSKQSRARVVASSGAVNNFTSISSWRGCSSGGVYPTLKCFAAPRNRRDFDDFIDPAKQDPPEAIVEDESLTKFDRVEREARRVRESQKEDYDRTRPIFLKAVGIDPDEYKGPPGGTGSEDEEEGEEEVLDEVLEEENAQFDKQLERTAASEDDDFYNLLDMAVANMKRPVAQNKGKNGSESGVIETDAVEVEGLDDEGYEDESLEIEDEYDDNLDEKKDEDVDEADYVDGRDDQEVEEEEEEEEEDRLNEGTRFQRDLEDDEFDLEFEEDFQDENYLEPSYRMTLRGLLEDAGVIPLAVRGDLDVEVTGIQHDSRQVSPGDMFVSCKGLRSDGHHFISEAVDRGVSVLVVSEEEALKDTNVRASVVVEDTNSILSALAAAFYGQPSRKLSVIGLTGTNGKTTTSMLLRSIYETMRIRTGLLGTIAYYINSNSKLDSKITTPDAVSLQKLMAQMVQSGTEACVMEVSSHALALDRCKEVDFNVAVFTNLTRDHMDFHETEEAYMAAKGKLFAKMTDPTKHRKVVNIDDPNAPYFIAQGSSDVPVITFSLENTEADVYALEVQLSLFETELLVRTPKGNVEISSGLLGRHNVYNILAAVAVGVAVEAPLKHIVRGIEEVDAVPGRCELIDEEQAFAVIVDYAHTPDALARLLDTVRECGAQRIITVVGCGGDRDRGKRPIMAKIATDKSDVCIFTSDNPRTEEPLDILDDMLAGVGWSMSEYLKWGETDYYPPLPNGHRLFVYDIRTIAVRAGVAMGEEGDAVVIAGKGHETYQIIGTKEEYFDDREECREALRHLDTLHAAGVDTSEFPWRVLESN